MRRLLLALPFALLPLAAAQASEDQHAHEHSEHRSLAAHEHGAAQLNVALDGNTLELALESPSMNIVGFEHAANSASDRAAAAKAEQHLQDPLVLFNIAPNADCKVVSVVLASPLFSSATSSAPHTDGQSQRCRCELQPHLRPRRTVAQHRFNRVIQALPRYAKNPSPTNRP